MYIAMNDVTTFESSLETSTATRPQRMEVILAGRRTPAAIEDVPSEWLQRCVKDLLR